MEYDQDSAAGKRRRQDKTKTKWGKAHPYELFIVAIWLATWLLFSTPENMSLTAKLVRVFVMYALAD